MEVIVLLKSSKQGISVIISTNKLGLIDNIIENYKRQRFVNKEMIIILHNNQLKLEEFEPYREEDKTIQLYSIEETVSSGFCMNFATDKSFYDYVSIFNDDDYYGPDYIDEAYTILSSGMAEVTGKYLPNVYFIDQKALSIRKRLVGDQYVEWIAGGSISFNKEVFKTIKFRDIIGYDGTFYEDLREHSYRMYASSPYGYMYIRYDDLSKHAWKADGMQEYKYQNSILWNVLREISYEEAVMMISNKENRF